MKKFAYKFFTYLLIILVALFILEYIYTNSYYNPKNPRSKTSWIMSLKSGDTLDYALLGSSRCINSLNPTIINNKLGTNGLNLAYAASNPFEIKLSLKTLLKKQQVKRVFIQVDYSYNEEKPNPLAEIEWMPFLKEDYIYNEFKAYNSKYWNLKNIPFYRYMKYDAKIGVRDLIFNYTKKSNITSNYGYAPLSNILKTDKAIKSTIALTENPHFREVIALCEKANVKIEFFTAPIYLSEGDNSALNKFLPNYHDFTNVIKNRDEFQDNTHVNDEGAKKFTEIFMNHYFTNKE